MPHDHLNRLLIDSMPIACIVWSADLRVLSWNPAAERVFEFSANEIVGKHLLEVPFIPAHLRAEIADVMSRLPATDEALERENENLTRSGRRILCQWTNMPLRHNGESLGVVSMVSDVTRRMSFLREALIDGKRLERLLAISQLKLGTVGELLERARDEAVALTSSEFGCVIRYDASVREFAVASWSDGVADGRADAARLLMADLSLPGCLEEVVRTKRPVLVPCGASREAVPSGSPAVRTALAAPLVAKGTTIAVVCVANAALGYDESDASQVSLLMDSIGRMISLQEAEDALRSAREQLLQGQKMEAVGRLAGGIAHDFNNLLQIMSGQLELLLECADDDARPHVVQLKDVVKRAAALIAQLLAFSRKSVIAPITIDLNEVIGGIVRMLGRVIGEHIDLATTLAPALWRIKADRSQVEQVVMNVVVNARDAMPEGGQLRILTANVVVDESGDPDVPEAGRGEYVRLSIGDNGVGMSEEVRSRVFEPFFTTKPTGKGVGLGLSVVYGIVKQSSAFISCRSKPDEGTVITVLFPRATSTEDQTRPSASVGESKRGCESVLLVEDDDEVRQITEAFLVRGGYRVVTARNGAEALSRLEESTPDLVLSDIVMPGMTGKELADRLGKIAPGTKVLFMSGYPRDAVSGGIPSSSGAGYLQKPFDSEKLLRRVREVLDKKDDSSGTEGPIANTEDFRTTQRDGTQQELISPPQGAETRGRVAQKAR